MSRQVYYTENINTAKNHVTARKTHWWRHSWPAGLFCCKCWKTKKAGAFLKVHTLFKASNHFFLHVRNACIQMKRYQNILHQNFALECRILQQNRTLTYKCIKMLFLCNFIKERSDSSAAEVQHLKGDLVVPEKYFNQIWRKEVPKHDIMQNVKRYQLFDRVYLGPTGKANIQTAQYLSA